MSIVSNTLDRFAGLDNVPQNITASIANVRIELSRGDLSIESKFDTVMAAVNNLSQVMRRDAAFAARTEVAAVRNDITVMAAVAASRSESPRVVAAVAIDGLRVFAAEAANFSNPANQLTFKVALGELSKAVAMADIAGNIDGVASPLASLKGLMASTGFLATARADRAAAAFNMTMRLEQVYSAVAPALVAARDVLDAAMTGLRNELASFGVTDANARRYAEIVTAAFDSGSLRGLMDAFEGVRNTIYGDNLGDNTMPAQNALLRAEHQVLSAFVKTMAMESMSAGAVHLAKAVSVILSQAFSDMRRSEDQGSRDRSGVFYALGLEMTASPSPKGTSALPIAQAAYRRTSLTSFRMPKARRLPLAPPRSIWRSISQPRRETHCPALSIRPIG